MLAAFVVFAPGQADRIGDLRASMGTQAEILADLHDHDATTSRCEPVAVPNHRPVPHIALWTGIPPGEIVSAQLEQPTRGVYLDPATERVLRNFTLDPRDPKRLTADVPPGFERGRARTTSLACSYAAAAGRKWTVHPLSKSASGDCPPH